jgi:hypothetical protein
MVSKALNRSTVRAALLGASALLSLIALAPARAWHLPWHHAQVQPSAPPVRVLNVQLDGATVAGSAASAPQSWDRNTLLVDLTRLGGQGAATLTPLPSQGWPARIAFRVRPGSITSLEVQGAQRVQFTVPSGGPAFTVRLDPGVYVVSTPNLRLRWSAADDLPR